MSETERNLKVAKECGAIIEGCNVLFCGRSFDEYTARILAERDAAHAEEKRQMAGDLTAIQKIHDEQKARLYNQNAKLREEIEHLHLVTIKNLDDEAEKLRKQVAMLFSLLDTHNSYSVDWCTQVNAALANTQATAEAYMAEHDASIFSNVIKFGASEREARLVFANMQDRDSFISLLVASEQLRAAAKKHVEYLSDAGIEQHYERGY